MYDVEPTIDVCIIDPASTEFNRGSFCYLPYILYSTLKADGVNVCIIENFTLAHLDDLPPAKQYLVALWSYPQIDIAVGLRRFLTDVRFFGYYPLIVKEKLEPYYVDERQILNGIAKYPRYFEEFEYILLSDCDMHLAEHEGQVYPIFTSYGCPKGCSFCPTTANTTCYDSTKFIKRIQVATPYVAQMLMDMHEDDMHNIHFTDEDFFFDIERAFEICCLLAQIGEGKFQLIALASADKMLQFFNKYGHEYGNKVLREAGFKLLEIGFETADPVIAQSMGKPTLNVCRELVSLCDVPILWLTLSYYPGETYDSIWDTGVFLDHHGFEPNELYGRIQTNGTVGGLGQFFQPYHGTRGYEDILSKGMLLSDRPVRLMPSFLPNSLLDDKIKITGNYGEDQEFMFWFQLYNLPTDISQLNFTNGQTMRELIESHKDIYRPEDIAIYLSLCARLGVVRSGPKTFGSKVII